MSEFANRTPVRIKDNTLLAMLLEKNAWLENSTLSWET
ncbi:putative dipeptidyl-aminopeptidase B [Venturia inaequalis]|nr:putative dipeptidyl-aminopeptidase B [Venturia inaequalis]